VATSGVKGVRCGPEVAMMRILPALWLAKASPVGVEVEASWPPIRSATAGSERDKAHA
jgi:hypothetical protein